jgi:hypothetical protein
LVAISCHYDLLEKSTLIFSAGVPWKAFYSGTGCFRNVGGFLVAHNEMACLDLQHAGHISLYGTVCCLREGSSAL